MKRISYIKATSLNSAVAALTEGKTAVLAGGTDILGMLKSHMSDDLPDTLVDIKSIPDMDYIREEGGVLKIGALTTLTAIYKSSIIQTKYTAISHAAKKVGTPALRNMGTIAGNICQGSRCWYYRLEDNTFKCLKKNQGGLCYALIGDNRFHSIFGAVNGCVCVNPGDVAPALVAFGATVVTNKREIPIGDFFDVRVAPNKSTMHVLASDEIVTEIQVPAPPSGAKSAYVKFALRKAFDFPIVSCAAVIGGGMTSICLNAVHGKPRKATTAEQAIAGQAINEANATSAANAALQGSMAIGKNSYMIQIAKTMVKRAILACQ